MPTGENTNGKGKNELSLLGTDGFLCVVIAVRIIWDICILIQDFRRKK